MQPTYTVFDSLALLLSQDTATIAPAANPPKLHLAKAPFVPNQDRVPADFTEADFGGYAAIAAIVGNQNPLIDPLTGERMVEMKIPAGGWRFTCTGLANTPQTIYGAYLMDNGGTVIFGSALLPAPLTIDTIAQVVEVDSVRFRFLFGGIQ
jgi:hypothetical protein